MEPSVIGLYLSNWEWATASKILSCSSLVGMVKLSDANYAGTRSAKDCTLILTEGDSAKALAVAGLGVVGRDYFGVFPLRGKLLNVREAKHDQILKNEEIQNIKKILGLQHNKDYSDVSSLRYGRLMIMADQVCQYDYFSHLCPWFVLGSWRFTYQRSPHQLLRSFLSISSQASWILGRICHTHCPCK